MKKLILLFFVIVLISAYQLRKWTVEAGPLPSVLNVIIPKGIGLRGVVKTLDEDGVVNKPWLFAILARVYGLDKSLRAGEYQFMPQTSMLEVLQKIAKGDVYYHRITIPEGWTTGQILYMISNNSSLSGEISLDVQEGELLPETYTFEYGAPRDNIIIQAKTAMKKVTKEAWEGRAPSLPIKTPQQMLILASIIEKETAVASEREVVASVFVNRLRKGMRLQTDPTVIYALTEGVFELGRTLKKEDLSIDSPYNTYRNAGLPPTPICNPGKEAIWAAVNPEKTDFIYFVADGNGGHNFSRSLVEHNQNVRNWVSKIRGSK